jgi:hypothetical protein
MMVVTAEATPVAMGAAAAMAAAAMVVVGIEEADPAQSGVPRRVDVQLPV